MWSLWRWERVGCVEPMEVGEGRVCGAYGGGRG